MVRRKFGFTIVELLIVISVLGIIATLVVVNFAGSRERAYSTRAQAELQTMANALKLYAEKYDEYPPEVERNVPAGISEFIAKSDTNQEWPEGPWPGSVYDYDNWDIDGTPTYQISIRFCPVGGPLNACRFPNESWATGFGINSAFYYCIEGNCRPSASEPVSYPGYCVNCPNHQAVGQ